MLAFSKPCLSELNFFVWNRDTKKLIYSFANLKMCEHDISLHPPPCLRIGWYKPHALSGPLRCFPPKNSTFRLILVFFGQLAVFTYYFSWNYVSSKNSIFPFSTLRHLAFHGASGEPACLLLELSDAKTPSLAYPREKQHWGAPTIFLAWWNTEMPPIVTCTLTLGAGSSATFVPLVLLLLLRMFKSS